MNFVLSFTKQKEDGILELVVMHAGIYIMQNTMVRGGGHGQLGKK